MGIDQDCSAEPLDPTGRKRSWLSASSGGFPAGQSSATVTSGMPPCSMKLSKAAATSGRDSAARLAMKSREVALPKACLRR